MEADQYTCKCGFSAGEKTITLAGEYLTVYSGGDINRQIPYTDIQTVHMSHVLGKNIWDAHVCKLVMKNGEDLEICNKSYKGIFSIKDSSHDYIIFLKELHKQLASTNPAVDYSGGVNSTINYIGLTVGLALFLGLVFLLLRYGKQFGSFGLIVQISWLLWIAVTFLKNRPHKYDPLDIPSRLLPEDKYM